MTNTTRVIDAVANITVGQVQDAFREASIVAVITICVWVAVFAFLWAPTLWKLWRRKRP